MKNKILETLLNENSLPNEIKKIRMTLKSATGGESVLLSGAKKMPIWNKKQLKLLDSLFKIQGNEIDGNDYIMSFK